MANIVGTETSDQISPFTTPAETTGDDTIDALGGDDIILTSGGFDTINAGSGNDLLDAIIFSTTQGYDADLGDGNDIVFSGSRVDSIFDLGAGQDFAYLSPAAGITDTVTLGTGSDYVLANTQYGSNVIFTDFQSGAGGDRVHFASWYYKTGQWWFPAGQPGDSGVSNPFAAGFAQLIDSAGGALLQVRSPIGSTWTTIITFQGRTAAQFHQSNFLGWGPDGSAPPASVLNVVEQARNFVAIDTLGDDEIYGTDAGGLLHYSNGNDVIHAGGGDDRISAAGGVSAGKKTIYGEAGNDQISINETNGTAPNGQTISATAWGLVFGGDGDDQIGGVGGHDEFHGDAGNDRLFGSGGNDLLDGGSGADFMAGGSGLDSFRGTIADFSGDTITDFARGDRLQITDANPTSFGFTHSGDSLSFGGSTITLSGSANLNLAAYTLAGGGVEITVAKPPSDHSGDGISDILWRNTSGTLTYWRGTGSGFNDQTGFSATIATDWQIAATGDITGEGKADLLWRHSSGTLTYWASDGSTFASTGYSASVGLDWQIAGMGDFTDDGRADILWRNGNLLTAWTSTGTGFANSAFGIGYAGADWQVQGVGDFTGDGRADILWRNANGSVTVWGSTGSTFDGAFPVFSVGQDWQIAGTGDFDGDSLDDVLWRNTSGAVTVWTSNGTTFSGGEFPVLTVGNEWQVADVGDYSNDGLADILWRSTSGGLTYWESTGTGFDGNTGFFASVGTDWIVQEV